MQLYYLRMVRVFFFHVNIILSSFFDERIRFPTNLSYDMSKAFFHPFFIFRDIILINKFLQYETVPVTLFFFSTYRLIGRITEMSLMKLKL